MQRDHTYHIWPRDLDFIFAFRAIEDFALKRGMILDVNMRPEYDLHLNKYEAAHPDSFGEFLSVLKQSSGFDSFRVRLPFLNTKNSEKITFRVIYDSGNIYIGIYGSDDDTIIAAHDFIRKEWRLSNPPIHKREEGRPRNLQATIFLGKHFDAESETPSRVLRQFLELLRFDVQEADEYRATIIPDKVKKLIERQDIYVGLVTGKRDHAWLTAEAAFAHGKDRHVIMVIEEGSDFNPTIQGHDYEQIRFPSKLVEKSFIGLMQEFRSLGISGL